MSSHDSMPRRLAAAISVVAGLALIGTSADGVLALDSELKAATAAPVPTRLAEDRRYGERDRDCPRPDFTAPRSPEV